MPDTGDPDANGGVYQIPVAEPPEEWTACFIVAIDKTGQAYAHHDVEEFLKNKVFDRHAEGFDMWNGATQVKRQLEEVSIAQRCMQMQMQLAQTINQQVEAQAMMSKLDIPGTKLG